jgi:hypothetical protein
MKKLLLLLVVMLVMVSVGYTKDFEDFGSTSSLEINEELNHQGIFLVLFGFYEASGYYYNEIENMKEEYDLTPDQVEILDRVLEMLYMENISVGPTVDELSYNMDFYSSTDNFWNKLRKEFHGK